MNLNLTAQNPGENNRAYACRILRSSIMTLRLQPGEPLNENELAAALQMSRTPVHEALTTLQSEWLVDIYPQRGTRVSRIDPALVKEGHATRLLLESALLRDVAGKISRSEIQELLNCMRRQEQLSGVSAITRSEIRTLLESMNPNVTATVRTPEKSCERPSSSPSDSTPVSAMTRLTISPEPCASRYDSGRR